MLSRVIPAAIDASANKKRMTRRTLPRACARFPDSSAQSSGGVGSAAPLQEFGIRPPFPLFDIYRSALCICAGASFTRLSVGYAFEISSIRALDSYPSPGFSRCKRAVSYRCRTAGKSGFLLQCMIHSNPREHLLCNFTVPLCSLRVGTLQERSLHTSIGCFMADMLSPYSVKAAIRGAIATRKTATPDCSQLYA